MYQETKVISIRVPSSFYLRVLEECADSRCTISEWLVLRIHLAEKTAKMLSKLNDEILENGCTCPITRKLMSDMNGDDY